mmetsp:Transcript_29670/g.87800  ORF Transcript_29670/g.87800 Transcript_29670/m.87800 type:complete len:279 (+) Transcript_29670:1797-2633(+)
MPKAAASRAAVVAAAGMDSRPVKDHPSATAERWPTDDHPAAESSGSTSSSSGSRRSTLRAPCNHSDAPCTAASAGAERTAAATDDAGTLPAPATLLPALLPTLLAAAALSSAAAPRNVAGCSAAGGPCTAAAVPSVVAVAAAAALIHLAVRAERAPCLTRADGVRVAAEESAPPGACALSADASASLPLLSVCSLSATSWLRTPQDATRALPAAAAMDTVRALPAAAAMGLPRQGGSSGVNALGLPAPPASWVEIAFPPPRLRRASPAAVAPRSPAAP